MNWATDERAENGAPYVYNGTARPLPVAGDYIGQRIMVANAAVPRGVSRLEWTGAIWAPPAGELIAGIWCGANPVALVTPGVTSLTKIYASPVIPDYMLPDGLIFTANSIMSAANASGVSGCMLGVTISGNTPTGATAQLYARGATVTPGGNPLALGASVATAQRKATAFRTSHGEMPSAFAFDLSPIGTFVSNACKLYAMAKPSGVNDQIRFDGASVISMGAL